MGNTGNDLCYKIKFENCVRKITFLLEEKIFLEQKYFILRDIYFKISKNLITLALFLRQILENIDMLRQ